MGSGEDLREDRSVERRYLVSRYLVTNRQFQAFEDDKEGYRNDRWWTEAGKEWRSPTRGRAHSGGHFDLCNHPVVDITWYEAVAFCRWLDDKLSLLGPKFQIWSKDRIQCVDLESGAWHIRLPTEAEWEKAARGTDGREYPWVGEFDPSRCNTDEAHVGSTSAVGVFPKGDSPYGCADMAGNVWEWCSSRWAEDYKNYDKGAEERENLEGASPRVLRGGSWDNHQDLARCAYRYWNGPDNRYFDRFGFRVVLGAA
jgi:formylglycine-generating enzyme required for sulfatase activity